MGKTTTPSTIIIDPAEVKLIAAFKKLKFEFQTENLHIGDIVIRSGSVNMLIIERKAASDLNASIIDGRYREQKARLFNSGANRSQIIYLLENLKYNISNTDRVWGAIANMTIRDGVRVMSVKNIDESALLIVKLAKSIEKHKIWGVDDPDASDDQTQAPESINVDIKKKKVELDDWYVQILSLIPGCSTQIANAVATEYPTIESLIESIKNPTKGFIANIKLTPKRKIGPVLEKRICEYIKYTFPSLGAVTRLGAYAPNLHE